MCSGRAKLGLQRAVIALALWLQGFAISIWQQNPVIWLGQEHASAQLEGLTVDQPSGTEQQPNTADSEPQVAMGGGGLGCCQAPMWLLAQP